MFLMITCSAIPRFPATRSHGARGQLRRLSLGHYGNTGQFGGQEPVMRAAGHCGWGERGVLGFGESVMCTIRIWKLFR